MNTCDCGCIEEGERNNHPPELVCKCAICSGHDTELWVHRYHFTPPVVPEPKVIKVPYDEQLARDLTKELRRECDGCQCPRCKKVKKLITKITEVIE